MYKDMPQLLSPTENGDFNLEHFEVRNGDIRAILSGVNPGNYVRLMHRGEVVMSDTYMEKRTNSGFCANAYGDVLIGGLGIGMIIMGEIFMRVMIAMLKQFGIDYDLKTEVAHV